MANHCGYIEERKYFPALNKGNSHQTTSSVINVSSKGGCTIGWIEVSVGRKGRVVSKVTEVRMKNEAANGKELETWQFSEQQVNPRCLGRVLVS